MAAKKISPRKSGILLDVLHVVIGLAVAVMAVFAILKPESYSFLFPVIFCLASLINVATGIFQVRMYPRNRKKFAASLVYYLTAALMFALAVISAISLWG